MFQDFSQFAGQYIAVVDNKVIATGNSQLEIYKQAKKQFPSKMITLEYVPTKGETLTFL